MDSSRSGLLSTLLMTLPLIVVPAIALLRPPGPSAGVSTAPLDASESSDDFLDDLGDLGLAPEKNSEKSGEQPASESSSEFDGLFEESAPTDDLNKPEARGESQIEEKPRTKSEDSFSPFDPEDRKPQPRDQSNTKDSQGEAEKIVDRLNGMGAVRTFWFTAGPGSPVGFAAFFRGDTELMRIRFEAVGQTREEVTQNVLDQVTRWQAAQAIRRQ